MRGTTTTHPGPVETGCARQHRRPRCRRHSHNAWTNSRGLDNSYSHDAAGNLTSRAPAGQADLATTYGFDSLNRLVNVQDPTGTAVDHAYDNMGRRTSTTTTDPAGNVATDTYLYDGWDLLNTASSTGDTAYTTVGGRVLSATTALGDTHYHPDATGNIGEATDDNGNVTTRNAYTPYGQTTAIPPNLDSDNPGTQYGYSGAWGVRDAGNSLLDMRNRTYDPTLGQFLSRDPLEATTGDAYKYAANNPIDLIDPTGQAPGVTISIGISITVVPHPRPSYSAPINCSRSYGLCDAIATSPPGTGVRCSATFGCRYQLGVREHPCPANDCGYRPTTGTPPTSADGGGGRSLLPGIIDYLASRGGKLIVFAGRTAWKFGQSIRTDFRGPVPTGPIFPPAFDRCVLDPMSCRDAPPMA